MKRVENGASLVEFSIAGTVFFTALFGVLEVSRLLWIHNTLTEAVRSGARYAVLNTQGATAVQNMVVYGNASGGTTPVAAGLTTANVFVTYSGNFGVKSGTATVEIRNYVFTFSVPMIGNTVNMPIYKSTMTGESAGTAPATTPNCTVGQSAAGCNCASPNVVVNGICQAPPTPNCTVGQSASGCNCASPNVVVNGYCQQLTCTAGQNPNSAGCICNSPMVTDANGNCQNLCAAGQNPTSANCVCNSPMGIDTDGNCKNACTSGQKPSQIKCACIAPMQIQQNGKCELP